MQHHFVENFPQDRNARLVWRLLLVALSLIVLLMGVAGAMSATSTAPFRHAKSCGCEAIGVEDDYFYATTDPELIRQLLNELDRFRLPKLAGPTSSLTARLTLVCKDRVTVIKFDSGGTTATFGPHFSELMGRGGTKYGEWIQILRAKEISSP